MTDQALDLIRAQLGASVVSDTGPTVEVRPLRHGLSAVLIPRGLPAQQEAAIRERLGLVCRHGRTARSATGRCPACTERTTA